MFKAMKYKGRNKKKNYFEGWYYKCVTKNQDVTLSFIPGVSKNNIDPHAFIQIIINDCQTIRTEYLRYDLNDFYYDDINHCVQIKNNYFSLDKIQVNIETDDLTMIGQVSLSNHHPIQTHILSPSIMGFFDYFPLMECNHDVVSMSHLLAGKMSFNDKTIVFDAGKGYIEKDYGRSFPEAYIWLQSNHFDDDLTSFMFTYATIPYLGLRFKGFIVNLIHRNKEYRFATYNFSKVKLISQSEDRVSFMIKKGQYRLLIEAKNKKTIKLKSPHKGKMSQQIKEGLSGEIHIQLKKKNAIIFEGDGKSAGIEIMI